MKRYACLDINNKVTNIIIADSLESAEKVTSSSCVLITADTKAAHIGLSYTGGEFEQPEPITSGPGIKTFEESQNDPE